MNKIKLRMTLDEIYEVDLSEYDFSYMNEERIKRYLISIFLRDLDKDCVGIKALGNESIKDVWNKTEISKTIAFYEIEFERKLSPEEIHIISNNIQNNRFDHDEKLRNIQN